MLVKDLEFRAFDREVWVINLNGMSKENFRKFDRYEVADCAVCYAYIDHEQGILFEVLSMGIRTDVDEFEMFDPNNSVRKGISIESVMEQECFNLEKEDIPQEFMWKIEYIDVVQKPSEEIEVMRDIDFIDSCRNKVFPDDLEIYLLKDETMHPEKCWVRGEYLDFDKKCFVCTLLNEPYQNYGCHEGDEIEVNMIEQGDDVVLIHQIL